MCGIAGILAPREPSAYRQKILGRMLSVLRHRGPDQSGVLLDSEIGLGNVRLSIIGIDNGIQPIGNEDNTLWIVFNGEAFNYIELKEELIQKGHRFITQTDTEVVLHLYEEFGPKGLNRINGQFAIAIWDKLRRKLFLARDRVGIRPLHYYYDANRFVFASEIKAIFQHPQVPREIDVEALNQVFTLWTTVTPHTTFRDIRELPPGHFMTVSGGQLYIEQFWTLPARPDGAPVRDSLEDTTAKLRELLTDAIRLRLRADVPVGAYLSGGLDSTIITFLTSKYFNNRLKTFSIGFEEQRFDETTFQDEAVRLLGTNHHRAITRNADIRDHFPAVLWHCEKPLLRTAPVPLYVLSRMVREHEFKVVLTGEGADETFGGYHIFKEAKVRSFWAKHPGSKIRPVLLERLYPYVFKDPGHTRAFLQKFFAVRPEDPNDPLFSHQVRWRNSSRNCNFFSDEVRNALNGVSAVEAVMNRLPPAFFDSDLLSKAQILEMDIFMSNYLLSSQGDRVAMANSLEIRMPFLDYRVIEFAMRLPSHWKIHAMSEKYLLRKAFEGMLPETVLKRPKHPYRAPIHEAFQTSTRPDYVDELLSESALKRSGLFDPVKTAKLAKRVRGKADAPPGESQEMAFLGILSTQILHRQFIEDFRTHDLRPFMPDKKVVVTEGAQN